MTLERSNVKISDTTFLEQPPPFYQPLSFSGKNRKPLFGKILKSQPLLCKRYGFQL